MIKEKNDKMKESVTKFDLEAAFKALDEIDIPKSTGGVKANKPALTEIFSRKSKFDALFEEYYDVGNTAELTDAQEARSAEVAKAKLARIEKIVDLDAESPEDLLTSYVGKYIVQCPQCMTLFYKNQEDVEESEEDSSVVNINEVCQHCGNDSGYTLVGKVGEVADEEVENFTDEGASEENQEDTELDLGVADVDEHQDDENLEAEDLDFSSDDLEELDLEIEDDESEEKQEESFNMRGGETLVEDVQDDSELDDKLKAHNEYIAFLREQIAAEEATLEKTDNEQVKAAIQRRIDAFKEDLEQALPDAVKNETIESEEEILEDSTSEDSTSEDSVVESLTEALQEEVDLEVSEDEFEELINSPEFKKPVSDSEVRAMMNDEAEKEADKLNEGIFDKVKDKLSGAAGKVLSAIKSRETKADWVLKNALKDYKDVEIGDDGNLNASADNRRFSTYIVIGYTDKYSNGKEITAAPSYSDKKLVFGMSHPEVTDSYKKADNIAKGWSQAAGNGPAYILLAKSKEDENAALVCGYFKGTLIDDKVNDLFEKFKKYVDGLNRMSKGGANQSDAKKLKASDVKQGMKIKLKDKSACEVVKTSESDLGDGLSIVVKTAEGETKTYNVAPDYLISVFNESLDINNVMNGLEELNESSVEQLISNSLIESYDNVAGFKLSNCSYTDNKFAIDGTIFFTSGNKRKTTYTFLEAFSTDDNKIGFRGLNEKLGNNSQFLVTGKNIDKTFIAESFKQITK